MGFLPWHWLLLALTHGLSCSWASNSPTPGVAEVDPIFPRNESGPPLPLTPAIFPIQNPSLRKSLDPSICWYIEQQNIITNDRVYTGSEIQGRRINISSSDPYVSYASTSHLTKEGTFMFTWKLCMYNCSQDPTTDHVTVGNHDARFYQLYFSINNTSLPDFVAATEDNTCNKVARSGCKCPGSVGGPQKETWTGLSCAVTLDMRRTPSPCKVKIDSSDSVSISAALTSVACTSPSRTQMGCPSPSSESASSTTRSLVDEVWIFATLLAYSLIWLVLISSDGLVRCRLVA